MNVRPLGMEIELYRGGTLWATSGGMLNIPPGENYLTLAHIAQGSPACAYGVRLSPGNPGPRPPGWDNYQVMHVQLSVNAQGGPFQPVAIYVHPMDAPADGLLNPAGAVRFIMNTDYPTNRQPTPVDYLRLAEAWTLVFRRAVWLSE